MIQIKKYIDWLFWKRTWFRVVFLMIPWFFFVVKFLLMRHGMEENNAGIMSMVGYIITIVAAILDNDSIDNIKNPFKKQEYE